MKRPARGPVIPARRVVPAPPPVRDATPMKTPLKAKDLARARQELEQLRETFERELSELEAGVFDASQSELSGEAAFDEEYADAGSFTFERERDLSLGNNIRDLLGRVNHALARVGDKTYGLCERCGQPIPKARLKALPYSTLCIACKQLEERR